MNFFKITNTFNKIFFNSETKLLSGFSFFIVSIISVHFIFYLNFFNFSGNWIKNESKLVTLQVVPQEGEKRIPNDVKEEIINFLSQETIISSLNIYDEKKIISEIGFDDLNVLSKIRIPLIIQLTLMDSDQEIDIEELIKLSTNRKVDIEYHKDDLYEISDYINRIKLFIFIFGLSVIILFLFFLTLLSKTTVQSNYKFIEILQIMGAENKNISLNLLMILIRKILPGSIFAIFFIASFSSIILKIFSIPFNNSFNLLSMNDFFSNIFLLLLFLFFVLMFLFVYLFVYLQSFLEKRFFE